MKKQYIIQGLDCPNCALKVQNRLSKNKGLKNVEINFVTKRIFVEGEEKCVQRENLEKMILKIETGVKLLEVTSSKQKESIMNKEAWIIVFRVALSTIILLLAKLFASQLDFTWIFIIYLLAYLIVAYDVIFKVFKNVFAKHIFFDENMLMFVATVGAFILGECFEGVLVMLLNQIGEMLQEISVEKSKRNILKTLDLRAKEAHVVKGETVEIIDPNDVKVGDILLIRSGDLLPVDGIIISGNGELDTSSLTGELLPINAEKEVKVLSGMVLKSGLVYIKATRTALESTAHKVMELVESGSKNKSKAENFISKFAAIYTPIVFIMALIVGIVPPLFMGEWNTWLYNALAFLVVSCPCAIIISVPLAYFVGIGMSAKNGIIVKGANYLERLNEIDTVMFDKTGTLTKGNFTVSKVDLLPQTDKKVLGYVCSLERMSNHPLALAMVQHFKDIENEMECKDVSEVSGMGMTGVIEGNTLHVGNKRLMDKFNIDVPSIESKYSLIYIAVNHKFVGHILVSDTIKDSSKYFVDFLKKHRIRTIMLTGDKKEIAKEVSDQLSLDCFYAELLPNEKLEILEEEISKSKGLVFIGDGINDAPSIVRSDVGMAMGGIGSDAAVESADVVVMNDDLRGISKTFKIAKITKTQAIINVAIALLVKFVDLIIIGFNIDVGISHMILAVIADVGLAIFLVLLTMLMAKRKV